MARIRRGADDDGFTVVELAVATLLALALLLALGGTLQNALWGSRTNRFRQDATAVAMERLEFARALQWDRLGMGSVDPQAPLLGAGLDALSAIESGVGSDEPLIVCEVGRLDPKVVETVEDVTFTTWTYVTDVSDSLRRVFVLVTWQVDDDVFTYRTDTLVSKVSAGGAVVGNVVFPDAAVLATGNVALHPAVTATLPGTTHTASVYLNGSFSNADAVVDGSIRAGGTVNATVGNVFGSITQNAGTPVVLPSTEALNAWRGGLGAEAQGGASLTGNQVYTDTTITAPLYVQGSIVLQGTVHIDGAGPVYATDAFRIAGGAVVTGHAPLLVSDALIEVGAGASVHFDTVSAAGMVSFGAAGDAIRLNGGPGGTTQGIAYAPYGGITLTGPGIWGGTLVAGGDGTGTVDVTAGATIAYPATLLPTTSVLAPLRPTPTPVPCGWRG
jgi:hypothetical protein